MIVDKYIYKNFDVEEVLIETYSSYNKYKSFILEKDAMIMSYLLTPLIKQHIPFIIETHRNNIKIVIPMSDVIREIEVD